MSLLEQLLANVPYLNTPFMLKLLKSVIVITVLWLLNIIIIRIVNRKIEDIKVRYRWRKLIHSITLIIAAILVGRIWFEGMQSIATFLGLVSAGVAIALKDVLGNMAGWVFIFSNRPFVVGDRIQIGNIAGDVIDLSLFQFSVLEIGNWVESDQSTGRIVNIPNGRVFREELANYDKGFKYIWNEIPVVITFESDWNKAKQILQNIANQHSEMTSAKVRAQIKRATRKFMIYYHKLTPIVYTNIEDSGVKLTVRYLCETRKRRGTQQEIVEDILSEFYKHKDIELAYPTTRFYTKE